MRANPTAVTQPDSLRIEESNAQSTKITPRCVAGGKPVIPKSEREELIRVAKMRARVSKSAVAQREAELLAEFEQQLAHTYQAADEAWRDVAAIAKEAAREVNAAVAATLSEAGVPKEFWPTAYFGWLSRGENADKTRRAELRKVAQTRIAAAGKAARYAIDCAEVAVVTELIAGALESQEARAFLERIPTPAELMPPIEIAQIEAAKPIGGQR